MKQTSFLGPTWPKWHLSYIWELKTGLWGSTLHLWVSSAQRDDDEQEEEEGQAGRDDPDHEAAVVDAVNDRTLEATK